MYLEAEWCNSTSQSRCPLPAAAVHAHGRPTRPPAQATLLFFSATSGRATVAIWTCSLLFEKLGTTCWVAAASRPTMGYPWGSPVRLLATGTSKTWRHGTVTRTPSSIPSRLLCPHSRQCTTAGARCKRCGSLFMCSQGEPFEHEHRRLGFMVGRTCCILTSWSRVGNGAYSASSLAEATSQAELAGRALRNALHSMRRVVDNAC